MQINPLSNQNLTNKIQNTKTKTESDTFKSILQNAQKTNDTTALKSATKQFETVFINMIMKNMRSTVVDGGLTEKSYGREMFQGMLDEKIAEEVAKGQGLGLSKMMYEQLSKTMNIEEKEVKK